MHPPLMKLVKPSHWLSPLCKPNKKASKAKAKGKKRKIPNQSQEPVTVSRHQQMLVGKQNYVEDSVYQCKRVDSEFEKGWVL